MQITRLLIILEFAIPQYCVETKYKNISLKPTSLDTIIEAGSAKLGEELILKDTVIGNMKFKINKDVLLENLNNVSKAVSTKNVIPVLGGIKFNLTNEGLFLTATNNDIDIECFINKKYIDNI